MVRTIFRDINTTQNSEAYRLLEMHFKDDMFDQVEVLSACAHALGGHGGTAPTGEFIHQIL